MDTKLTLRLNDNVIERAKIYARNHKISLSKMIESYLDSPMDYLLNVSFYLSQNRLQSKLLTMLILKLKYMGFP